MLLYYADDHRRSFLSSIGRPACRARGNGITLMYARMRLRRWCGAARRRSTYGADGLQCTRQSVHSQCTAVNIDGRRESSTGHSSRYLLPSSTLRAGAWSSLRASHKSLQFGSFRSINPDVSRLCSAPSACMLPPMITSPPLEGAREVLRDEHVCMSGCPSVRLRIPETACAIVNLSFEFCLHVACSFLALR